MRKAKLAIAEVGNNPHLAFMPWLITRRLVLEFVMMGPGYTTLMESPVPDSSSRSPWEKEAMNALDAGYSVFVRDGGKSGHTGNVHDVATLILQEVGNKLVGDHDGAAYVELDDLVYFFGSGFPDGSSAAYACVVDEEVDREMSDDVLQLLF